MRCCWQQRAACPVNGSMSSDKQALRRAIRQAFPGKASRDDQSIALCRHVMAWEPYRRAEVIAGYMPMGHEADVTALLLDALASGKVLALPRCDAPGRMTFRRVNSLEELIPGAYGLPEPTPDAPAVPPADIDLMLVPLEAISRKGQRLGKGGGYYDRVLARWQGLSLGVALAHQWVEDMPCCRWDMPIRACADAEGINLFDKARKDV